MLKLHTKLNADLLLYLLSHFECDGHTVHTLTQWHLPPPLTSTVKSSLFTQAHSSPLSWLPGYIDVVQTILVILTMAELFPHRLDIQFNLYQLKHQKIFYFYVFLASI